MNDINRSGQANDNLYDFIVNHATNIIPEGLGVQLLMGAGTTLTGAAMYRMLRRAN